MSATSKIGLGVAAGYLLGRTKKFKLGHHRREHAGRPEVATNPQALLEQGSQLVEKNPELRSSRSRSPAS